MSELPRLVRVFRPDEMQMTRSSHVAVTTGDVAHLYEQDYEVLSYDGRHYAVADVALQEIVRRGIRALEEDETGAAPRESILQRLLRWWRNWE